MAGQTASSHARYIPYWHFIVPTILLLLVAGTTWYMVGNWATDWLGSVLFLLISILFVSIYWYARWFALRAQDRAIRAEENLRHFILTGKPLDRALRMRHIIALRFADDEEFPALANKTAREQLSPKDIKKEIRKWKADHHRV